MNKRQGHYCKCDKCNTAIYLSKKELERLSQSGDAKSKLICGQCFIAIVEDNIEAQTSALFKKAMDKYKTDSDSVSVTEVKEYISDDVNSLIELEQLLSNPQKYYITKPL